MTPTPPAVIWQATLQSGTYRIVDLGAAAPVRFMVEQQLPADAMGAQGWQSVGLPIADVLEAAFTALYRPA